MINQLAGLTFDGIEIEMGSCNVFVDLGLPDADKLKIKSGLVIKITKAKTAHALMVDTLQAAMEDEPVGRLMLAFA